MNTKERRNDMMQLPYQQILEVRSLKDDLKKRDILSRITYHIHCNSMCKMLKKSKKYVTFIYKKDIYSFVAFAMNIKDDRLEVNNVIDTYTIKFKNDGKMVIIETRSPLDEFLYITDKRDKNKDISFDVVKINNAQGYGEFCYGIMIDVIVDYMRGKREK